MSDSECWGKLRAEMGQNTAMAQSPEETIYSLNNSQPLTPPLKP